MLHSAPKDAGVCPTSIRTAAALRHSSPVSLSSTYCSNGSMTVRPTALEKSLTFRVARW